jgi:hypothetical protein
MICGPCRPVHTPADCIDSTAGREHPWRHCVCQHQPRQQVNVCDVVGDEPEGASADE